MRSNEYNQIVTWTITSARSTVLAAEVAVKLDDDHDEKMVEDEEYKLRVMMIKKKHSELYRSMMRNRKKRMNKAKNMERKSKEWDDKDSFGKEEELEIQV